MRAERWQGAGNVYLIVEEAPADVAAACRDHEADGVLVLAAVSGADVAMRIINPDGSEPEACGNGTRNATGKVMKHKVREQLGH